ncbi:hypothetical protein D516_2168 [Rhodobacter sp. AKP1]|nr:hypothetical protein D516_2168 [Rhodobacter sp. AKP1]
MSGSGGGAGRVCGTDAPPPPRPDRKGPPALPSGVGSFVLALLRVSGMLLLRDRGQRVGTGTPSAAR